MKSIVYITASYFIDTDYYVVKNLSSIYKVKWFIFHKFGEKYEYQSEIEKLKSNNVKVDIVETLAHDRLPGNISIYTELCKKINLINYDAIFLSVSNAPYFIPVFRFYIKNVQKVVLGIHNVHAPKGAKNNFISKKYTEFAINKFENFQTYSRSQRDLLQEIKKKANILCVPFFLKDYGTSRKKRICKEITFLNFGNIRDYKRLDVLINAAEGAYKLTGIKFRVIIAGKCDSWDKYQTLIKTPDIFDIRLGRVENEDVADLFNECDYFVAPYQDIAQSGSSVVAVNYCKPIIASRLPAFEEYIEDKKTGFLIRPANESDLQKIFVEILRSNNSEYERLVENLEKNRKLAFSDSAILNKYVEFLNNVVFK